MHKETIKQLATWSGKLLGLLGLVYVIYTLFKEYTVEQFLNDFYHLLPLLPLFILINFLSTLLGIKVWHRLLKSFSQKTFAFYTAFHYFAKTEIAKYLPGNVFHIINRQIIATKVGLSQKQMGHVQFILYVLLLLGTLIASTLSGIVSNYFSHSYIFLSLFITTISIVLFYFLLYKHISFKDKLIDSIFMTLSLLLQAVILVLILNEQNPLQTQEVYLVICLYILSWAVGFVTPGASGGLGVREAAFLALATFINFEIATENIVFAVLFLRLINILVDILYFSLSYLIPKKYH